MQQCSVLERNIALVSLYVLRTLSNESLERLKPGYQYSRMTAAKAMRSQFERLNTDALHRAISYFVKSSIPAIFANSLDFVYVSD